MARGACPSRPRKAWEWPSGFPAQARASTARGAYVNSSLLRQQLGSPHWPAPLCFSGERPQLHIRASDQLRCPLLCPQQLPHSVSQIYATAAAGLPLSPLALESPRLSPQRVRCSPIGNSYKRWDCGLRLGHIGISTHLCSYRANIVICFSTLFHRARGRPQIPDWTGSRAGEVLGNPLV